MRAASTLSRRVPAVAKAGKIESIDGNQMLSISSIMVGMAIPFLPEGIEVGSLAEWFGAIGTIAGVFVTGLGLLREGARRRADIAALRREEEDRQASQARLVFSRADIRGLASLELTVTNESSGPILNLTAQVLLIGPDEVNRPETVVARAHADRLDANSFSLLNIELGVDDELVLTDKMAIALHFTDMAGLVWSRLDNGEPQRVIRPNTAK